MKGLNVLLTGACGRIGKTIFDASKDRYRFTLTDRIAPDFDLGEHHFVHADLSDKSSLAALLDGRRDRAFVGHSPRQRDVR